jgi:hypothetical protein
MDQQGLMAIILGGEWEVVMDAVQQPCGSAERKAVDRRGSALEDRDVGPDFDIHR